MRVACMTCFGAGTSVEHRGTLDGRTIANGERCRTCHGDGWYSLLDGPGVDPAKRHGTGIARPDAK